VLVLDLNMPGGSSLEAIPVIRKDSPDTQIVVLTMQQESDAPDARSQLSGVVAELPGDFHDAFACGLR